MQQEGSGALWFDDVPEKYWIGGQAALVQHKIFNQPAAYWSVKLIDIKIGDKALNLCPIATGCKLAVDSGTSLLTAPSESATKILLEMNLNQDCSNFNAVKDLVFVIEATDANGKTFNKDYPMTKDDYVLEENGRTSCSPGISSLDVPAPNGPVYIVGDMFMQKYFSIFDRDAEAVFMAPAAHMVRDQFIVI